MQPKVSQGILSSIQVASIWPPQDGDGIWSVRLETPGDTHAFPFNTQTGAEEFFKTLEVAESKKEQPLDIAAVSAGARLYTHDEVKGIVDAAVHPLAELAEEEPPLGRFASIWRKVRSNWKNATLIVGALSFLLSSVLTLKVSLGPVKVPEIIITLPDGTAVPPSAIKVETRYKLPVTNGLKD